MPHEEPDVVENVAVPPEEEEEVYNPPLEEVEGGAVEEEQSVPEVINEVPNNVVPVVAPADAPVSHEEAPKKSYASIVGFTKATFSNFELYFAYKFISNHEWCFNCFIPYDLQL
jgi:Ras GTPase-activating protein-binding protein 1